VLRCPRKGCQTTRSVRTGNTFFHYTNITNKLHCNLSLCEILELIFLFVLDIPMSTVSSLTGKSANTVTDRFNMCVHPQFLTNDEERWSEQQITPSKLVRQDLLVDGSTTEEGCWMETTLLCLRTVTQIKITTETMGVELMDLGFLVLNKAQTVGTFGQNGVTATL